MVSDCSNGIYRGIIAALIGVILLGAAPKDGGKEAGKNTHTKTEIGKSAPTITASSTEPVQIIQRPIMERPCNEGRDNRESDLCAQWKAADAASKAAWWSAVATFVTAIGTFGLFWQIKLTREAVQDTGEATNAMREANEISRDQQRARLLPVVEFTAHIGMGNRLYLRCENVGLSPAYKSRCKVSTANTIPKLPPYEDEWSEERVIKPAGIEELAFIDDFEPKQFVFGIIEYITIFGERKSSYFCFGFAFSNQSNKWFAVSRIGKGWPSDT